MLPPKRERTRAKLLEVTQRIAVEKGTSALTFRDICYAADMSPGTIYNYYRTLEQIYEDIETMVTAAYHHAIDQIVEGVDDPGEVIAYSTRQTLYMAAISGGAIGKLCFEASIPQERFIESIRTRFAKDLAKTMQSGLFQIDNPQVVLSMASGAMVSAMMDLYNGKLPIESIDELAEVHLRMMGMNKSMAATYARLPIKYSPITELPLSPYDWLDPID